jgi:hypothetical protein
MVWFIRYVSGLKALVPIIIGFTSDNWAGAFFYTENKEAIWFVVGGCVVPPEPGT